MTPDTILTLGDFDFSRAEIPEKINFGGDQHLAKHKLVGGARTIDAMGRDDDAIEWSGLFMGETAELRALYLDGLRIAGTVQRLTWSTFDFDVVVSKFQPVFERYYQIPYKIICEIVADNANPVTFIADPGIDDLIQEDMNSANALGGLIGDGPLSSVLGGLDGAIRQVSSFANAAQSTINSVLIPLAAVQSRVKILIASVGNTVINVGTLGGVLPNSPIAQQSSKLLGQMGAMTQLPQLYGLQSVLGRMGGNLGSIGGGAMKTTTAGGNLFQMAAANYSDPTAWTTLAKANNLTDPMLNGISSVIVPPRPAQSSGGVLDA